MFRPFIDSKSVGNVGGILAPAPSGSAIRYVRPRAPYISPVTSTATPSSK